MRPYAVGTYDYIARLSNYFEFYDPSRTRSPIEYRHPMMDLRLVEFCLSIPAFPWCFNKDILRRAMKGVLPEPVRRRPKTPLAGCRHLALLREPEASWIDRFAPTSGMAAYVDRAKIPSVCRAVDRDIAWRDMRPLSLNLWLRALQPFHA
jgi:asparagine synthase (glutamine-hydrolysing)